jgi:hypothetical protein
MTNTGIAFLLAAAPATTAPEEMQIWIPVIAALAASALTGLTGLGLVWLQQRHQRKTERVQFMRSKLEETHEVGRSILVALLGMHTRLSMVVATNAHPNTMEVLNNTPIERGIEGGTPKLRMLVEFYCPTLLPELVRVEEAVTRQMALSESVLDIAGVHKPFPAGLLDELTAARDEIRNAINDFHSALSQAAQGLKA